MRELAAVLPLRAQNRDKQDYRRADLLFESLRKHAKETPFAVFTIVVPPDEVAAARSHFHDRDGLNIEIVNELELIPGLARYRGISGWTRQQIIKLFAAAHSPHPFTITFDADVICTRPFSAYDLVRAGRALLDLQDASHRPWWNTASARLLDVKPRTPYPTTVTPAILARPVCQALLDYLSHGRGKDAWLDTLLRPLLPYAIHKLRPDFRWRYRWSEYTLYCLMLEKMNTLNEYHVLADTAEVPQRLVSSNSVWWAADFPAWNAAPAFGPDDPAFFCIVQSNMHVDPDRVRELTAPYLKRDATMAR